MLRVAMGGIASKLFRLQFCRANVLFVENLTHERHAVQFLSVHKMEFHICLPSARRRELPPGRLN